MRGNRRWPLHAVDDWCGLVPTTKPTHSVCLCVQSNYTLFRVWGIPIRVNISLLIFLPILAWLIGSGAQLDAYAELITTLTPASVDEVALAEQDRWTVGILAAVGLFASVAVHELGHSWMAMRYGIGVESITLWILGGLASLAEMPKEWNREFWIAIAGPVTSVLVGALSYGVLYAVPADLTLVVFVVGFLAVMNVFLAVFNMLPAFPMDGGRVLRALLARRRSYVSATQTAARIGTLFAFLFAILGVLAFSPILLLLALFIYAAATGESRAVVLGELLQGLSVADIIESREPLAGDTSVQAALDQLLGARRSDIAVAEDGAIIGVVTAERLREVDPAAYETTTVGDIATTDLPRIDAETSAFDGMYELLNSRQNVAVVERDGEPVGVVSRADFSAVLEIRRDMLSL
jgi:Zn-dependent protease